MLQSRRGVSLDEAAAEIDRPRTDNSPLDSAPITAAIAETIRADHKIEGIKLHRKAHSVGFNEAKDGVDVYEPTIRSHHPCESEDTNLGEASLCRRMLGRQAPARLML